MGLEKEILKILKDAKNRLNEEEIRSELEHLKSSFCETLNRNQQMKFKIICCWYEKLMEYTNLDAFDRGAFSASFTDVEEDYENFIKEQEELR